VKALVVGLVIIAILYAGGSFLLYRGRIHRDAPALSSDALVFCIPTMIAFIANTFIIWQVLGDRVSTLLRLGATLGLAIAATLVVGWCWAVAAFSLYGT
jgi:hypothetical protein